jgi:hypothetical protein
MAEEQDRERTFQHADAAKRLQDKLLRMYEELLDSGAMTAADRKNLQDLLLRNGWSFDPNTLPQSLKDKITERMKFDDSVNEDFKLQVMG